MQWYVHVHVYMYMYMYMYMYVCCDFIPPPPIQFQVGYDMTKAAATALFSKSSYRPDDVDVVELHDCFSANELITYEALGLCGEGK